MTAPEDERLVDLFDDELDVLPDTPDDLYGDDGTARLLEERPPHWG